MKTIHFFTIMSLLITLGVNGQTIDQTVEIKSGRAAGNYAENKLKKGVKKIFINEFRVFFELIYVDQEQTRAGVNYGSTKATLKVGLDGVSSDSLQRITDRLYKDYTEQLRSEGYTIVLADEAAGIKQFEDYQKVKGGTISSSQIHGFAMVTPTNYEYFIKKVDKKGKQKNGLMDKRPKISGQLGDVAVVNVNLMVSFMEEAESRGSKLLTDAIGGVSKVVAEPGFRLAADLSGITSQASYLQNIKSGFSSLNTPFKKDIRIEGVFEKKKYKAVSSAQQNTEYDYGAMSVVFSQHVDATNLQLIQVDQEKYYRGAYNACKLYLTESTNLFLKYSKGEK